MVASQLRGRCLIRIPVADESMTLTSQLRTYTRTYCIYLANVDGKHCMAVTKLFNTGYFVRLD